MYRLFAQIGSLRARHRPGGRDAEKEPNTAMREHFQKYLDKAERKYDNLPTRIRAGIELCQLLNDAGTDLALYA